MTSASRNPNNNHRYQNQATTSKPPKSTPTVYLSAQPNNPINPDQNPNNPASTASPSPFTLSPQDQFLSRATHLTRHELLKRRSHNLKQLSRCYRDYYWTLMEELKTQYREYYWNYGVSPFKEDQSQETHQRKSDKGGDFSKREDGGDGGDGVVKLEEGVGENLNGNGVVGGNGNNFRCLYVGCKLKAMALTSFCHLHILSDAKQKLYKPCGYVIKSAQAGNITCGKAILRSTSPPLCGSHFQKAQKHVLRALKKAGLSASSSSKLAPKLHVVVAEYVRQVQSKRRAAKRANLGTMAEKESVGG